MILFLKGGQKIVMICTNQNKVEEMLLLVKEAIKTKNYKILDDRRKFLETLTSLGITKNDVILDIANLSINDEWVCKEDNNPCYTGEVWITKKKLYGNKIYIKIKIKINENNKLLIMSYHIDEYDD